MHGKDKGVPVEQLNREQLQDLILANNGWFGTNHPDLYRREMSREGFMRASDMVLRRILMLQRKSITKISGRFKVLASA